MPDLKRQASQWSRWVGGKLVFAQARVRDRQAASIPITTSADSRVTPAGCT
jgi:hypothetical protein